MTSRTDKSVTVNGIDITIRPPNEPLQFKDYNQVYPDLRRFQRKIIRWMESDISIAALEWYVDNIIMMLGVFPSDPSRTAQLELSEFNGVHPEEV